MQPTPVQKTSPGTERVALAVGDDLDLALEHVVRLLEGMVVGLRDARRGWYWTMNIVCRCASRRWSTSILTVIPL